MSDSRPTRIVKVGDTVTWAACVVAERVIAIREDGVIVHYRGDHFVAWDGHSHEPMLRQFNKHELVDCRLRFDNIHGDYVDGAASFRASLS